RFSGAGAHAIEFVGIRCLCHGDERRIADEKRGSIPEAYFSRTAMTPSSENLSLGSPSVAKPLLKGLSEE
ncbi:MAG: hypothetical protein QNL71_11755, partial [Akkermansiaceae bacterium]